MCVWIEKIGCSPETRQVNFLTFEWNGVTVWTHEQCHSEEKNLDFNSMLLLTTVEDLLHNKEIVSKEEKQRFNWSLGSSVEECWSKSRRELEDCWHKDRNKHWKGHWEESCRWDKHKTIDHHHIWCVVLPTKDIWEDSLDHHDSLDRPLNISSQEPFQEECLRYNHDRHTKRKLASISTRMAHRADQWRQVRLRDVVIAFDMLRCNDLEADRWREEFCRNAGISLEKESMIDKDL